MRDMGRPIAHSVQVNESREPNQAAPDNGGIAPQSAIARPWPGATYRVVKRRGPDMAKRKKFSLFAT